MKIYLFIIALFIISCQKDKATPMVNVSLEEHINDTRLVLEKGDEDAYDHLSLENFDSPNEGVFLYTSLIMANKYKYPKAYFDAYCCLTDLYHKKDETELDSLDDETRKLALDILTRGAEQNSKDCKAILGKLYIAGKYFKRDISKGNQLLKESE